MKYRILQWKRALVAVLLIGSLSCAAVPQALAAQKLYDQVETQMVTKGVVYEKKHRLTDEGWQDINVLKVDLNTSNIRISPVDSSKELGLKETVLTLLSDNGAVAGVNASFFGMKGTYSNSFGVIVDGGNIESMGSDINNEGKNEYATLFVDKEGNPFIDYFRVNLKFMVNGNHMLDIAGVNKVTEMIYPICFNKYAAASTQGLDQRFSDLVKIVVENGVITKVSAKGETVNTPENGFLIVKNGKSYEEDVVNFPVGSPAELAVLPSLDLDKIQTAISGGGKILENGGAPQSPGITFKTRQPRTAVGITADKNTLIIMTVDGRGDSIGASQDELVALMKEYGVTDAMNMDGGGSTTMAVKTAEEDAITVKNQVSDGAQRKVINALGIFNDGPVGEITELVVKPSAERVFAGGSVSMEVFGYDEYYHKIPVGLEYITFTSTDEAGQFNGNQFVPGGQGKMTVTAATTSGASGFCEIESMTMAALKPSVSEIRTELGQTASLTFTGVSQNGFEAAIPGTVEVTSDMGAYQNGVFTPTKEGAGYLMAAYGELVCYLPVTVGGETRLITSFEGMSHMNYTTSPSGMPGDGLKSTTMVADGAEAVGLKFQFQQADTTQAAYLHFLNPIAISGKPSSLGLSVYGNNSGAWVRGRLKDANGSEVVVDFTKNMDFTGWKELSAQLPADTVYPLTLEALYVAELKNSNINDQVVYFDKLTGRFPYEAAAEIPQSSSAPDPKNKTIGAKEEGSYYINMSGTVTSSADALVGAPAYNVNREAVQGKLSENADLVVYAGKSDINAQSGVEMIRWENGYKFYDKQGVSLVQLTAANGSMRLTNTWQWMAFRSDVLNSANKNVVFMLDRMPSDFSDKLEGALFESVLAELRNAGKTIFVVSANKTEAWSKMDDGIWYINLPDLWLASGAVNPNYKILKLKVTGDDLSYEMASALLTK